MEFLLALVLAVVVVGLVLVRGRQRAVKVDSPIYNPNPKKQPISSSPSQHDSPSFEPLPHFDWKATPPIKFRPFRPIYYITMALQADTPSDLIAIDSDYITRITHRRTILATNPTTCSGYLPSGTSAVYELYTYLLSSYLPQRYPTLFTLTSNKTIFTNHITNTSYPASPPPTDPLVALRILCETVEDDLFLVQETDDGEEHRLVAFVCCFPSGFDPSDKLGKVLKDIHEPVPGYEKIGQSMERFFKRLEVGRSVKRINWSVTTQSDLFNPTGNHIHDEETVEVDQEVDIDKARVRMEHQTLTRLPQTNAILFSFKSYLYPVTDIKAEGLGPEMADAVEGLKKGNAPGMWTYKGGIRWGKSVCEYLRS